MKSSRDPRIENLIYLFLTGFAVLALDQAVKFVIYSRLSGGQSMKVIPNIFHITLVLNKGAAFGLLKDQRIFFIILSVSAIFFIIAYIWKNNSRSIFLLSSLGLLLGGATGNLIDRIRFGYVIDFLDFRVWPVFNVADSAITIGAAMFAAAILLRKS